MENMKMFDPKWPAHAYYWAHNRAQCENYARILQGTSPVDYMEFDLRDDWHLSNRLLRCESAA